MGTTKAKSLQVPERVHILLIPLSDDSQIVRSAPTQAIIGTILTSY